MKRQAHFEVYESADGWRWRLKAANGLIIADSGEAYTRKDGADRAVKRLKHAVCMIVALEITLGSMARKP